MTQEMTIIAPDDMHAHLRDGDMLRTVLPYTARHFARAIVMPNLVPAVKTVADADAYRKRILELMFKVGTHRMYEFVPMMTLYLTEDTPVEEIERVEDSSFVHAFKFYPRGATTNSSEGVRDFARAKKQLAAMEKMKVPLLIHGETNLDARGEPIDPFDKERYFIENELPQLRDWFPELRIVLEHITTKEATAYIADYGSATLGATITPHHLVADRRALFDGGLNPHFFCLPVLKRSEDLDALRRLAAAGYSSVFAGTDTAPHPTHAKERACGCAGGCFVAPVAVAMYAQVFEEMSALQHFEAFMSKNGAAWYRIPQNTRTITLARESSGPGGLIRTDADIEVADGDNSSTEWQKNAVRPFGLHTDPNKNLLWNWRVTKDLNAP